MLELLLDPVPPLLLVFIFMVLLPEPLPLMPILAPSCPILLPSAFVFVLVFIEPISIGICEPILLFPKTFLSPKLLEELLELVS